MSRGTLREATRVGQASKAKGAFFVEFKKAEPAVPQDAGKTPSACPNQRRPQSVSVLNTKICLMALFSMNRLHG